MKKTYENPEMDVRIYCFCPTDTVTTSDPETNPGGGNDLNDDDVYDDVFGG